MHSSIIYSLALLIMIEYHFEQSQYNDNQIIYIDIFYHIEKFIESRSFLRTSSLFNIFYYYKLQREDKSQISSFSSERIRGT